MIEIAPSSENYMSYNEALLYCVFYNYNGYTDWRIPTRREWMNNSVLSGWYLNRRNDIVWHVMPVRDNLHDRNEMVN